MMNVNHRRKTETFNIDDMRIKVTAYQKTSVGNPAGFSVKVDDWHEHNKFEYHVNVLDINEAIFRGLHKFLQRELGLDDMVTYMNVRSDENARPVTLCIKARDGKFLMHNQEGEFLVEEKTSCSDDACGFRHWEIYNENNTDKICSVCKSKGEDFYLAVSETASTKGTDLYEAAARLIIKSLECHAQVLVEPKIDH